MPFLASRLGNELSTPATTSNRQHRSPLKRRRQPPPPDQVPSPPLSRSTPARSAKRRKTGDKGQYSEEEQHVGERLCRTSRFWDDLSHVPLVKAALRELDRRNKAALAACAYRHGEREAGINCGDTGGLQRFARQGGPDLTDLRGIRAGDMPPRDDDDQRSRNSRGGIRKSKGRARARGRREITSQSGRSESINATQTLRSSHKSKTSSPYDTAFKQQLLDWKVYPDDYYHETGEPPPSPANLGEITTTLCNTSRSSLEPEASIYEKFLEFRKAYDLATSEEAASRTLDTIEGVTLALSSSHIKRGPVKLTNLLPLLPENFTPGNPDRTYGARPEKLDQSLRSRGEFQQLILPTAAQDVLCPNFVVHVKGPAGNPSTAKTQAVYDGALAARGMEALWAFGHEHDYVPNARTITCTFADGVLRMYTIHIRSRSQTSTQLLQRLQQMHQQAPSAPKDIEYITSLIGSWLVRDRPDEFLRGATAFRNGLEWARQQRDEAIARANSRVDAMSQANAPFPSLSVEDAGTAARSFTSHSSDDPISAL